ncbi:PIN domain-containing protein [Candidatus Pacearchaeota archaeon]|nr:PIN domain-containing protein [Candidatus Pacearchaeota archaeon]
MTEFNEISLFDSNILIYAFAINEKEKNTIAKRLLDKVINNELQICLSTQNISEFYYGITKKIEKPIDVEIAREIVKELISLTNIKIFKIIESTIINAIDVSIKFKLSFWDSLIVAVMEENNIREIITENEKDFKKIPLLNIFNPFKNKSR